MADKTLFFFSVALITIGIVFSYSLPVFTVLFFGYDEFHFAIRQLGAGVLGVVIMWVLARLDPDVWLGTIGFGLFFTFVALMALMPFLPSELVTSAGGAARWIRLPGFSLAPVEFLKVGFIYFIAWSFSRKFVGEKVSMRLIEELLLFVPYAVLFIGIVFLIAIVQNDLGQVVVLGMTLAFLVLFAGRSLKLFLFLISSSLILFVYFILSSEHRISRIMSWWATSQKMILSIMPEHIAKNLRIETVDEPYQISHSLNAIHHGGIFGTGIGNGTFKLGYLSEVHTDFVLAGIAEETGFVGVAVVTILIFLLIYRIFRIANRSPNDTHYLFSVGVSLMIGFSFLMNAYGISGLTPIKGIAVPFLSYGGSALLAQSIAVGMVLMISKKAHQNELPRAGGFKSAQEEEKA